ncbi:MAG: signal peptidase I [Bacillales bacterium]|nr:signal peptidase I [Bacillales bacterium]
MDWLDIKEFIKDSIKYILFVLTIIIIAVYVIGFNQVIGSSMNPTLNNNDVLILDKLVYRLKNIKRYDIVAINDEQSKYIVKRVIGLPNDKVVFKDNILYINDEKITEDYKIGTTEDLEVIVPKDMYFVLGDNRENSSDSRDKKIGFIKKENILGKIRIKLWPFNKFKIY